MVLTKTVIPLALTASRDLIVKYIVANDVIYFFRFVFRKRGCFVKTEALHTYAPKIGTSVPKIISKGQKKKKQGNIRETSEVRDGRRPLLKY